MSALDKVLALAEDGRLADYLGFTGAEDESAKLVRTAAADLNELALLLADSDDDDDESDDDEDEDEDDEAAAKKKGKKGGFIPFKKGKKKPAKGDKVKAAALVLEAMVALSGLQGGEQVSLSVLTQKQREKPSAHTIADSDDYPIPDLVHLGAAVARYKQGKFAGHPASVVKAHILSRAKALGREVDLASESDSATLMRLTGRVPAVSSTAMHHTAYSGSHSHPHRSVRVVDGPHYHNDDNRHSGDHGGGDSGADWHAGG